MCVCVLVHAVSLVFGVGCFEEGIGGEEAARQAAVL